MNLLKKKKKIVFRILKLTLEKMQIMKRYKSKLDDGFKKRKKVFNLYILKLYQF